MSDDSLILNQSSTPFKADIINNVGTLGVKLVAGASGVDSGYADISNISSMAFTNNKLRVQSTPYGWDVALGNLVDHTLIRSSGRDVATILGFRDISQLAADTIPLISTVGGDLLEIVSTSAQDATGGTGLIEVRIGGINSDGDADEYVATMTGTTPVNLTNLATDNKWIAINHVCAVEAGTSLAAVGTISLRTQGGGGTTYATIVIGDSLFTGVQYTVPTGKKMILQGWTFGATNKETLGQLMINIDIAGFNINTTKALFNVFDDILVKDSSAIHDFDGLPLVVPAGATVKVRSRAIDAAGGWATGSLYFFIENE